MAMTRNLQLPQWISLQLMTSCNLRCRMCYEWGETGAYFSRRTAVLPIETIRRVVKECEPASPHYALFGGEPMMYPFLGEAIESIRGAGSRLDMPTNGTFLQSKAALLCDHPPSRIWISLDGPERINDIQRGAGVYNKVRAGAEALRLVRQRRGLTEPKIGYTFIVTPLTYKYIEEFVSECLDLEEVDHLSIEFQTFITFDQAERHRRFFQRYFGVPETPCAHSLARHSLDFQAIDTQELERQVAAARDLCAKTHTYFITYPKTIAASNYQAYFSKDLEKMADVRTRCVFPWVYVEIAASGDVTPCHTFYDYPVGNVNTSSLSEVWRGPKLNALRSVLKEHGLFPACSGCPRYYADPSKH